MAAHSLGGAMRRRLLFALVVSLLSLVEPAAAASSANSHVAVLRIANGAFSLLCSEDTYCDPGPYNGVASPATSFNGVSVASGSVGDVGVFTDVTVTNPIASFGDGIRAAAEATFFDDYLSAVAA